VRRDPPGRRPPTRPPTLPLPPEGGPTAPPQDDAPARGPVRKRRAAPVSPTDWRTRLRDGAAPRRVVLEAAFAGVPAGHTLFVPTPGLLADRILAIPEGGTLEMRTLRDALARAHGADATCPVTTALFLRIVAEAAWDDLQDGTPLDRVIPFWRAIDPASPVAARLRCGPDWIRDRREAEAAAAENGP
jgi:hypothetical protein